MPYSMRMSKKFSMPALHKNGETLWLNPTDEIETINWNANSDEIMPAFNPFVHEVIYISGMSGCGKSYCSRMLADSYNMFFPKNRVILFSQEPDDVNFENTPYTVNKINSVDYDAPDIDEFETEDFKDSLVILDDIDANASKKVVALVNTLLSRGRHSNIKIILTNHTVLSGNLTKLIKTSASKVIFFKDNMRMKTTRYFLNEYCGINDKMIDKLKNLNSRWFLFSMRSPLYVLTEHSIISINDLEKI